MCLFGFALARRVANSEHSCVRSLRSLASLENIESMSLSSPVSSAGCGSTTSFDKGATLAGAPPTARLSKCTISSVTRAWSGMPTLKPRQRSTHVLEHAQTHHGIPLHTKDARNSTSDSARNSRARHPARPSKCTISSTVRARSGTPTHIIIYIYI